MKKTRRLIFSAMFLAMGMVLPFITGQIKEIGEMLLPMHIPVLLCGLVCGPWYGLVVGAVLPIFRNFIFSKPPYPIALWMAFELAAYGGVIGFLYQKGKKQNTAYVYFCLISAMIAGRLVWGVAKTILLGFGGKPFTFAMFITEGFVNAVPGIILQLILIPAVMIIIKKKIK